MRFIRKRKLINYQVKQQKKQEIGISKNDGAQDQFCYIIPGAATFHAIC